MPQPSRTDRRPRQSCSLPRSRTCMVRYPIIFRLSSNPSRANTILPSIVTVPWATFELASAMDITPKIRKLPSSVSDVWSRVGRLVIKVMTPTTVRITVWTMRKLRSSSKQTTSRHLLTVDIMRFNKPMASFNVLLGALRLTGKVHVLLFRRRYLHDCYIFSNLLFVTFPTNHYTLAFRYKCSTFSLKLAHTTESDVEIQTRMHFRLSSGFRFGLLFRNSVRRFRIHKQNIYIYPNGSTCKVIWRDFKTIQLIS